MSTTFSVRFIVEEALRKIGSFVITDGGADGEAVRVGLSWLDLIMAHVGGTNRLWWLVPTEPILVNLVNGQERYVLPNAISANAPLSGFQFPLEAFLDLGNGDIRPVQILRRDQWDEIKASNINAGDPIAIYIDRLAVPTVHIIPVPTLQPTQRVLRITCQTFGPSLASSTISGTSSANLNRPSGLRASYQMWAIYQLAATLADGTIKRMPTEELQRLEEIAEKLWGELMAFENSEHESLPPTTESADSVMFGSRETQPFIFQRFWHRY